eukprot:21146_1
MGSSVSEELELLDTVHRDASTHHNSNRMDTRPAGSVSQHHNKTIKRISPWTRHQKYPHTQKISSNCIAINSHEFIVASAHHLYKYDIHSDQWSVYKPFPLGFNQFICTGKGTMAFDNKTRSLYVFNKERQLLKLNLCVHSKATSSEKKRMDYKLYPQKFELLGNEHASSIFVHDTLHIIGGSKTNKHYTFNEKYQRFEQIHRFTQYRESFSKHALVHIKSQNRLLLFGGEQNNSVALGAIYSFCLCTSKWTEIETKLPFPTCNVSAVVSSDESHVVLFAGFEMMCSLIWIMDAKTFAFRESNAKTMQHELHDADPFCRLHAVLMDHSDVNEVLVYGYLKGIWTKYKAEQFRFLSDDCICIILCMYGDDDVHIVNEHEHLKIKLSVLH